MALGTEFFIDALCLVIHDGASPLTQNLIGEALEVYNDAKKDDAMLGTPTIAFYASVLAEFFYNEVDCKNESLAAATLLKFKNSPVIVKDKSVYNELEKLVSGAKDELPEPTLKRLRENVRTQLLWTRTDKKTRMMMGKSSDCLVTPDPTMQSMLLDEIYAVARDLVGDFSEANPVKPHVISTIDFADKDSIKQGIEVYNERKNKNLLKTGLQGFNKILHPYGAFYMGEFGAVAALSHHFKSGTILNLLRWIVTYNMPDPDLEGIPTIILCSLENESQENMMQVFIDIYIQSYHEFPPKTMTNDEIIEYVHQALNKNGWRVIITRQSGEAFGFKEYCALIREYQAKGHRIYGFLLDYLTIMNLEEFSDNRAINIQKLGESIASFTNHEGIFTFTGLQLAGSAAIKAEQFPAYAVKRFNMSDLADSKGIIRALDFLMFTYIEENHEGEKFLTMAWGKRRYAKEPPAVDRYAAYKFNSFGILDDINGESMNVEDIYAIDTSDNESNETMTSLFG